MGYSQLYYKCQRPELIQHIKPGNNRILDVGCAEGMLGESLKQHGMASELVGIELFPDAAKVAERRLDRVICGDFETMERKELGLEPESFDYIICGDVLEHLRDPWSGLSWLVSLLKRDGRIIASVPNVRHWSVSIPLLIGGRWEYREQGILDCTHLRFFTRQSALKMLRNAGLDIEACQPLMHRRLDKLGSKLTLGALNGLFCFQWLIVGQKKNL